MSKLMLTFARFPAYDRAKLVIELEGRAGSAVSEVGFTPTAAVWSDPERAAALAPCAQVWINDTPVTNMPVSSMALPAAWPAINAGDVVTVWMVDPDFEFSAPLSKLNGAAPDWRANAVDAAENIRWLAAELEYVVARVERHGDEGAALLTLRALQLALQAARFTDEIKGARGQSMRLAECRRVALRSALGLVPLLHELSRMVQASPARISAEGECFAWHSVVEQTGDGPRVIARVLVDDGSVAHHQVGAALAAAGLRFEVVS